MARSIAAARINPRLVGFRSLAGGVLLPIGDYPEGCPTGRTAGRPTNVAAVYAELPGCLPERGARMADMSDWLPYLDWPSLGEGGTPLLPLAAPFPLAALEVKAEWTNPTGSHKDRASALSAARALDVGARGIACASSGNGGVSLAAYAARAGLPCRVVVTPSVPTTVRRRLAAYGADIVEVLASLGRWRRLAELASDGWFPATNYALPASGSTAFGVEGYRTIAFELAAQRPDGIDAVLVPTARGDLLSGIALGFAALREAGLWRHRGPQLVAVEPFPRLAAVLSGSAEIGDSFPGATRQSSTAGSTATDQALLALRSTGGTATVVGDAAAEAAQFALARQGLLLELCAAAPVAGVMDLIRRGTLGEGARVVLIATAGADRDGLGLDSGREPTS
jgi:threonine synthase